MQLINTIDELRELIAINTNSNYEDIKPYIQQAELKFIKPVIGKDLYNELLASISEASSSSDTDYTGLLQKVRLPLAYYAYYLALPILNVQVSSGGIHIVTNENKKTAFPWQIEQLSNSWLNTAHDFIESLLEYLEENISDFPTWKDSSARVDSLSLFITSANEFNDSYFINGSRRLYSALKPILKSVEQKYIKPTIGDDLFDAIKDELQSSGGLSDDTTAVLDIIRPCMAHFTMARALVELPLDIIPNSVFEVTEQIGGKVRQPSKADKIALLREELTKDARAELKQLQEYLDTNASATKYAEYFNSTLYQAPVDGVNRGEFVNDQTKGFYFA